MRKAFQIFIDVDKIFWGNDVYRWWFYAAIIIILLFERRKMIKISLAWYSVAFLIGLFMPLSNWIMSIIEPAWQYRARLYSMLPIPYALALGSILLMDKLCGNFGKDPEKGDTDKSKWSSVAKFIMVGGISVLIILGGTNVYQQDWMKPAQNLEKVPPAVLELKEKLGDEKDICVAVPESLSIYIRQAAPEFYTPYGRTMDVLGMELSQLYPDPKKAMIQAGTESCDYIVVYSNEINAENFRSNGYEPYDSIEGYLVYKVEGVPFHKRTYNEKRQTISVMYLDENGNPMLNSKGYAGIAYEYDKVGNRIKEIYLDSDGRRKTLDSGYAAIARTYTAFAKKVASIKYLDENDAPVLYRGRYETRNTYNADKLLETESYYDQNGAPMIRSTVLYASRKIQYDQQGRIIGEQFFGTDGEPVISSSGYAAYTRELDAQGRVIKEIYYGTDGLPMPVAEEYAQIKWVCNEAGQRINETYWDKDGNPVTLSEGYHGVNWEYDEAGNIISETYLDTEGKETPVGAGYTQVRREFDNNKNKIRESYFAYGKPFVVKQGYTTLVREYNESRKIIREAYLDESGNPVKNTSGYASYRREYESHGWISRISYYDEEGKLTLIKSGYAIIERSYDLDGNVTEERYLDPDENPVNSRKGYAIVRRTWNENRQLLTEKYYDTEDKLTNNSSGVAALERSYDGENLIKEIRYDTEGNVLD